ncbi:hypothetical protein AMD27_02105 [Acinetobacter sp. TGL-Y2]|uniref:hypothetical protein n=1 Tax=Acinetobacter sp. TGL-Y2 TaxID=1407071 RepID=UPI0007A67C56|nr:hypothetical protein [Acinetobacter sp. TGL-Y2]AMW77799.1 hypothetical protein AMD27_02105 [Acinetobacter sp. TGL-Y2]
MSKSFAEYTENLPHRPILEKAISFFEYIKKKLPLIVVVVQEMSLLFSSIKDLKYMPSIPFLNPQEYAKKN